MWHRIAVHVLHCTVDEAQERLTSKGFTDMVAYYCAEPFGNEIDNYRFGTQTAAIVNTIAASAGKRTSVQASDYYPQMKSNGAGRLTPQQKEYVRRKRGKRGNSKR